MTEFGERQRFRPADWIDTGRAEHVTAAEAECLSEWFERVAERLAALREDRPDERAEYALINESHGRTAKRQPDDG